MADEVNDVVERAKAYLALAAKATPGPWRSVYNGDTIQSVAVDYPEVQPAKCVCVPTSWDKSDYPQTGNDFEFIAASHDAGQAAALLKRLDELDCLPILRANPDPRVHEMRSAYSGIAREALAALGETGAGQAVGPSMLSCPKCGMIMQALSATAQPPDAAQARVTEYDRFHAWFAEFNKDGSCGPGVEHAYWIGWDARSRSAPARQTETMEAKS